jgi:HD-GYP domain-containing protein (c-di-GMP phosphodiesterase class II)
MPITIFKIRITELKYGMYVSRLDRPWLETPFPIQGFIVKSEKDKERLEKFCDYVYVDVNKSHIKSIHKRILLDNGKSDTVTDAAQIYHLTGSTRIEYEKSTSREEELRTAKQHFGKVEKTYQTLLNDAENDIQINLPVLRKSIKPMVRSIVRNPDAFIWLSHLKSMDSYTYHHAISCSVWAVAFGRHLGLPETQLNSLAMGCFLFDIGKCKLPKALLNSAKQLTIDEFESVKQHVAFSLDLAAQGKGADLEVLSMIETHHERHNGSGYPLKLKNGAIPLFGRIAGVVDVYDAITSHRPFCKPMPAYEAIQALYQWRGVDFQTELVEQFIQVIGIYPVGSLVELSDATVGVVIAQNDYYRLRPLVMILLDENKQLLNEFHNVDLRNDLDDQEISGLTIAKGLPPGAYDLDQSLYYF